MLPQVGSSSKSTVIHKSGCWAMRFHSWPSQSDQQAALLDRLALSGQAKIPMVPGVLLMNTGQRAI